MANQFTQSPASGPAASDPDPAQAVWDQVLALAELAAQAQEAQAGACGLRPPVYRLLHQVVEAGESGIMVSAAATRLGVRPQALAGPAAELAEAGLIQRLVDKEDGRARRLMAAPAGVARLAPAAARLGDILKQITQAIPQASVARLVLERLQAAVSLALVPAEAPVAD